MCTIWGSVILYWAWFLHRSSIALPFLSVFAVVLLFLICCPLLTGPLLAYPSYNLYHLDFLSTYLLPLAPSLTVIIIFYIVNGRGNKFFVIDIVVAVMVSVATVTWPSMVFLSLKSCCENLCPMPTNFTQKKLALRILNSCPLSL